MRIIGFSLLLIISGTSVCISQTWLKMDLPEYGRVEVVGADDDGYLYAGVEFGYFHRSSDDGASWHKIEIPTYTTHRVAFFEQMKCHKDDIYVVSPSNFGVYMSQDHGTVWKEIGPEVIYCRSIDFGSSDELIVGTEEGIAISDDGGLSWEWTSLRDDSIDDILFLHDSTFLALAGAQLYKTTDLGQNYEVLWDGASGDSGVVSMCQSPNGDLYVGCSYRIDSLPMGNFNVARSTNEGETWSKTTWWPYWAIPRVIGSIANGDVLAVTDGSRIRRTTDYGETWERFSDGYDYSFGYSLTFTPDGRALVGSAGCVYISNQPVGVESPPESPVNFSLSQSYPNPVSAGQTASMEFALPTEEQVSLALYNVQGRQVATLVEGRYGPGRHTVPVRTAGLRPGVYVYRVIAGGKAESRMMMVIE